MNNRNDGGHAFPTATLAQKTEGGMTLRDYFAAKAMAALVGHLHEGIRTQDLIVISEDSYMLADAMLAAREAR